MVDEKQYHEKVIRFGPAESLVGIITKSRIQLAASPAVIFLNAGLLHRVGIQRIHVDLARDLARIGIASFRVDLYGIGESISQAGDKTFRQRAFDDINEAINFLSKRYSFRSFVLIGHCAGADNAFPVLVNNDQIMGAVLIDGFGFPTIGFKLRDLGGRSMVNPLKWSKYLIKSLMSAIRGNASAQNFMDLYGRCWPTHNEAENDLKKVIERGAQLLFIYTGGVPVYYNHGGQFKKMFPTLAKEKGLTVQYFKNADHNLTRIQHREELSQAIVDWLKAKFIDIGKIAA